MFISWHSLFVVQLYTVICMNRTGKVWVHCTLDHFTSLLAFYYSSFEQAYSGTEQLSIVSKYCAQFPLYPSVLLSRLRIFNFVEFYSCVHALLVEYPSLLCIDMCYFLFHQPCFPSLDSIYLSNSMQQFLS
jgi:hypothetical protein